MLGDSAQGKRRIRSLQNGKAALSPEMALRLERAFVTDILGVSLTLDREYLVWFLVGLSDEAFLPAPVTTIYREIKSVPPAMFIKWKNEPKSVHRYWTHWEKMSLSRRNVADAVYAALEQAVRVRNRNGKVGVVLSGGLDSSSVACILATLNHEPIFCYSNVFETIAAR